jgi:hypothetical protein
LKAWPWKPNTSSWVEPTAHTLVALKKASAKVASNDLRKRVSMGEAQLLGIRCSDGGWNYGNRFVLGVDLPSYPETTALGLLGLQGRSDLGNALDLAGRQFKETTSPLARAWLSIALRLHGASVPEAPPAQPSPDLLLLALETLAALEGHHAMLKTEVLA